MAGILHIDTVDMGTLGLVVENITGHRHAPRKKWPTRSVPGAIAKAAVVVSSQPEWHPRTVDIFGKVVAQDAPKTHDGLLAAIDALETAIHTPDVVDLSLVDDLTVKLIARCERFEVDDIPPGFVTVVAGVRIQFVAHDPRWVAV